MRSAIPRKDRFAVDQAINPTHTNSEAVMGPIACFVLFGPGSASENGKLRRRDLRGLPQVDDFGSAG